MQTQSLRAAGAIVAACGLTGLASASILQWQVSPAGAETWSTSIDASPGQTVDIRLLVSYVGTAAPMGFGSVFMQPSISNWDADGSGKDTLLPFVNIGGASSTPVGHVPDQPGVYGRIAPFGWRAKLSSNNQLLPFIGHVNAVSGTSYLRIAAAPATAWVPTPGPAHDNGSLNFGQPSQQVTSTNFAGVLTYNPGTIQLPVFKIAIQLGPDTDLRTLSINAMEAFANMAISNEARVKWYASPSEQIPGSIVTDPIYQAATINVVPGPWSVVLLGAGVALRRRR